MANNQNIKLNYRILEQDTNNLIRQVGTAQTNAKTNKNKINGNSNLNLTHQNSQFLYSFNIKINDLYNLKTEKELESIKKNLNILQKWTQSMIGSDFDSSKNINNYSSYRPNTSSYIAQNVNANNTSNLNKTSYYDHVKQTKNINNAKSAKISNLIQKKHLEKVQNSTKQGSTHVNKTVNVQKIHGNVVNTGVVNSPNVDLNKQVQNQDHTVNTRVVISPNVDLNKQVQNQEHTVNTRVVNSPNVDVNKQNQNQDEIMNDSFEQVGLKKDYYEKNVLGEN